MSFGSDSRLTRKEKHFNPLTLLQLGTPSTAKTFSTEAQSFLQKVCMTRMFTLNVEFSHTFSGAHFLLET